MDIKRSGKSLLKKRIRTAIIIVIGLVAVGGVAYGLKKMKAAAPTLDRSTAVIDTVKRGQMLRELRNLPEAAAASNEPDPFAVRHKFDQISYTFTTNPEGDKNEPG